MSRDGAYGQGRKAQHEALMSLVVLLLAGLLVGTILTSAVWAPLLSRSVDAMALADRGG
jgi:hypothetical protein